MKMFSIEMQKKTIRYEYEADTSLELFGAESVYLDRSRVLQVLINLFTNAIKFTHEKDHRMITLRISASVDPQVIKSFDFEYISRDIQAPKFVDNNEPTFCLSFAVTDTGQGLTREEKNRLFRRFAQATPRTHAKYGGSGLGLFISRQICELHGGQIGVGSAAGVGSTFAFYIRC